MENKTSKRDFKKGISTDDSRRKREMNSLKLRKEKKEEGLAKKRNLMDFDATQQPETSETQQVVCPSKSFSVNDIPEMMSGINSSVTATQLVCLRGFRRLLSIEKNPPVQECIDCGAVPMFVQFLQRYDNPELQFEAAWALTNIASTDRTSLVVECQAIPHLVNLLNSPSAEVREQCAWCLGNVAGDGAELREYVLSQGALQPLLANIAQPASLSLLRNCVWSLSNFCRGKPQPALSQIAPAFSVLASVVANNVDKEATADAIWALSYLSDGDNSRIQAVVDQNITGALVQMLTSKHSTVMVPALRTLGNMVSGSEAQTQAVVEAGVLNIISQLLVNKKKNVRKEACWLLSNVAAGSLAQLNQLFCVPELIGMVLDQLSAATEWDVRKEAAWVISNIATSGQKTHVVQLVEQGAIRPLCELLDVSEVQILMLAMDTLEAVLKVGGRSGSASQDYCHLVDEAGGVDALEHLQEHENTKVYEKAVSIIERYFGVADEEESENLAPAVSENAFSFGMAAPAGKASTDFSKNQMLGAPLSQHNPVSNTHTYQFNF